MAARSALRGRNHLAFLPGNYSAPEKEARRTTRPVPALAHAVGVGTSRRIPRRTPVVDDRIRKLSTLLRPIGAITSTSGRFHPVDTPQERAHTPHALRVPSTRRDTSSLALSPGGGMPRYRARQQRRRREQEPQPQAEPPSARRDHSSPPPGNAQNQAPGHLRRAAAVECGWCLGPIIPKAHGPVPKWCSASCRQRAWEQRRAAASGLSAVEVVERVVEVPVHASPPPKPRHQEWRALLRELERQLDRQLVYDRHLAGIAGGVHKVYAALGRRLGWGSKGLMYQREDGESPTSPPTQANATWTSPRPHRQQQPPTNTWIRRPPTVSPDQEHP